MTTTYGADAPSKRRIAVFDFDNPPVQTSTASNPWIPTMQGPATTTNVQVGETIADLLITKLVRDGSCVVIERKALKKLLDEQNLSNSDRVDPTTAARLGRILGVDAIVVGSVTRYDHSDRTTGRSHNFGAGLVRVGDPMKSKHDVKADVEITARIVSPDTAEILAVADGDGVSERKNVKEDATDRYYGNQSGDVQDDATNKAVADLATRLEARIAQLPERKHTVEAVVADVNPSRIIINAGSSEGVKAGDRLQVWRPGKPIRDPETGKVLRWNDQPLGEAVVTDVDNASAAATYTSSAPLQVGDRVRTEVK